MRIFVGFDDTDIIDCGRGTGKLARWYTEKLPEGCRSLGVVRQQLLHSPEIPMTSHNSSLCVIVDAPDSSFTGQLISIARDHILEHFFEGSDPGLCVVDEANPVLADLALFGNRCTFEKVTLDEAIKIAAGCHLSGHGGTNMGMIGAAAATGLTWKGDSGRLVDWKDIRELPDITTVREITKRGITLLSVNRHGEIPAPDEKVNNFGSLRPRLFSGRIILPVIADGAGCWNTIIDKRPYTS